MQTERSEQAIEWTNAPVDRLQQTLDVRALGPPKPLVETLEALGSLDEETVLVQLNDRAPQHLYPKLRKRGYEFETVADDGVHLTAIWRSE